MQETTERKTPVTSLGPLETRLMDVAWTAGRSLSVQDVVDRLGGANYKTVMTVLNRLVEKEMLARDLDGRAYRYRPTHSREDFLRAAADGLVRGYIEAFGNDAASHLADAATVASPSAGKPAEPQRLPVAYRMYHPSTSRKGPLLMAGAAAVIAAVFLLSKRRKS